MGKANKFLVILKNISDNTRTISSMDLAFIIFKMAIDIKELGWRISRMGTENNSLLMDRSTKATGSKMKDMGKEHIQRRMSHINSCGRKDNWFERQKLNKKIDDMREMMIF